MERFVIIVKGWKLLTFIKKLSILDVAATLDRLLTVRRVLPSSDSEIRGDIVRIAKTNTILKRPVNELFAVENTYHDINQTDKASLSCESWIFAKENPDKKKKRITNFTLKHLRTDFRCMMGEKCLNTLLFVYIHRDIFLDYDKIINIYASNYPRRMLLINPPN